MDGFKGKVALITGGASGMGKVLARRLSEEKAQVAIFDVNEDGLADAVRDIRNVAGFKCDVASNEMVKDSVRKVEETLGPIDILVTAAALMPGHKVIDESSETMGRLFDINYFGIYHMI